jgi:hypothetical protein
MEKMRNQRKDEEQSYEIFKVKSVRVLSINAVIDYRVLLPFVSISSGYIDRFDLIPMGFIGDRFQSDRLNLCIRGKALSERCMHMALKTYSESRLWL